MKIAAQSDEQNARSDDSKLLVAYLCVLIRIGLRWSIV
jgi:hypothetical protein